MTIKNYSVISTLYSNDRTIVYQARSPSGGLVAIKTVVDVTDVEYSNKLYREFAIAKNLSPRYVPQYFELFEDDKLYLIKSFEVGKTLAELIPSGGIDIEQFLLYAISIVEAIGYIHEKAILHLDLTPTNILYNEVSKGVKLLDFCESISNYSTNKSPKKFTHTTKSGIYLSPEQTGLSNQDIDERSDLYSLGIIFYEMLCGQPPFYGQDTIQIAHAHLAQIPKKLHEIKPTIPVILSDIVQKLLSKDKQERYQHITSLEYDLEHFAYDISKDFNLGRLDVSDRLVIQNKLYGREKELDFLKNEIFSTVNKKSQLIMISGYSGVGKSSFINALAPAIFEKNGYFVKGKFDQYNHITSYLAFIQIFTNLINTFNDMPLILKQKSIDELIEHLGESKNVLIKIIPQLQVTFNLTNVINIDQSQLKNQLFIAIERFFSFFASKEHPLVIFLDDMQWADVASLEMLELIYSSNKLESFLILGAYRKNEVNSVHPMRLSLKNISNKIGTIEDIELHPLNLDAITQFLSDTLHTTDVDSLAELLIRKTEGNPFFLKQFLYTLTKKELLYYNKEFRNWEWDIQQIGDENLAENVVEHLVAKIGDMSLDAQIFIQTASAIGDIFDLKNVSFLTQLDQEKVSLVITELFKEGLIEPSLDNSISFKNASEFYHFVHDKIRQAAYFMLSSEKKEEIHLQIFHTFLLISDPSQKEVLDVAQHILEVIHLVNQNESKTVLELLNQASSTAKAKLAYEETIQYSQAAISILPQNSWLDLYKLTFSLHFNLLESLIHTQKYDEAAILFNSLLSNDLLNKLDSAKIYNLRLSYDFSSKGLAEAIEDGRKALEILGQFIPNDSSELLKLKEQELYWLRSNITSIEDLQYLPQMNDETTELCMNILINMGIPAFVSRQDIFLAVTFRMVRLSFLHGNCNVSSYGYMLYGMILGAGFLQYQDAYKYGQVAIAIQEKYNNKAIECKLLRVYGSYVASWIQPHEQTLSILHKAYMSGIENGDFFYSTYCINHIFTREFLASMPLDQLEQNSSSYLDFIPNANEPSILMLQHILIHIPRCLRGNTLALNSLSSQEFDEHKAIGYFKSIQSNTLLAYYYIYKLQICYIHQFYDEAVEHAVTAKEYLANLKGNILESEWVFYYALTLFRQFRSGQTNKEQLDLLCDFEAKFKTWSELCPQNFLAKFLILQGVNSYVTDNFDTAFRYFEQALAYEDQNAPTLFKAVTLELMGECSNLRDNWRISQMYFNEAYFIYYDLKATAKAKLLFNSQSDFLHHHTPRSIISTPSSQKSSDLNIFDEDTILKATQLISGKLNRSELIEKFTHIIAQSFGIQIGGLILQENESFYLEGLFNINRNPQIVISHQLLELSNEIPKSIINHMLFEHKLLIIEDAMHDIRFAMDHVVAERKIVSVICAPIFLKEDLIGLVYMENNLIKNFFDNTREKVLNILLTQTAVTLELETLYSHDKLTGCLSRQKLDEVLSKNEFSALLLINISSLDSVNSTYGYAIGDRLLQLFVKYLYTFLPASALLFRISGDEFALTIPKNSFFDKEILAANIITSLQEHKFSVDEFTISLSCTIGITDNNEENFAEDPLVRAHAAMKEIRFSGTNKFLTYSPNSQFIKNQKNTLEWISKVKNAIKKNTIVPFFQPIIDNHTQQIVKYECLARMLDDSKIIAPYYFIEPARLAGLLPKLTKIMFTKSFQYFSDKPFNFSLNITEEDLKEQYLPQFLQTTSERYNISPNRVTLEILENISAYESDAAIEQLLQLKAQGYKIALDDFGSEKSNFLRLQKLNVDYIKIDGSFIKNIDTNQNNLNICKTIVHLGQSLQCEIIAEFVHSQEVYDIVKKIGIQYSQGYHFGMPSDFI